MKPQDNSANLKNSNPGTPGTNRQYDQAKGNTGKQLNPIPNDSHTRPKPAAPPKSRK